VHSSSVSAPPALDTHDSRASAPLLQPVPPSWIRDLIPVAGRQAGSDGVDICRSGALAWLSARIPAAAALDARALQERVAAVYADMGRALAATQTRPVRFWNYLPDPGAPMAPHLDRYMVFNAGRHAGLREWLPDAAFETHMPTASAVGTTDGDLVVHCLASETGGRAVHNPRQRQPWMYSARYGPRAPSFSRAVAAQLGNRALLVIGGTASIVGEDSVHVGDTTAQVAETLENMTAVIATSIRTPAANPDLLARLQHVRVYVAPEADDRLVAGHLRDRLPACMQIDMRTARLCRPELLVEIEGLASLPSA
jgi:chorismate lyase / 3-hydroxybenzoate synthase